MSTFHLKIVTPENMAFDSDAESVIARTVTGDVCILSGHTEYIAPLSKGQIKVKTDGKVRIASTIGGTLVVTGGDVTIIADTFDWE